MTAATFIRTVKDDLEVTQRLYRLPRYIGHSYDYETDRHAGRTDHVVVSHAHNAYCHETLVFAADADGRILSWSEIGGAMHRTLSDEEALAHLLKPEPFTIGDAYFVSLREAAEHAVYLLEEADLESADDATQSSLRDLSKLLDGALRIAGTLR